MDIKNLMVGNYVMFNGRPVLIEEISVHGLVHLMDIEYKTRVSLTSDYITDDITGVPLTAEILMKNGWTEYDLEEEDHDTQYRKVYGKNDLTWWSKVKLFGNYYVDTDTKLHYDMVNEMPIEYVHQLQNVMRLLGIEEEIKL